MCTFRPSSTPEAGEQLPQSKVSIVLLCLSTADVSALYTSLSASNPTAESMAVAIAGLQTAWPQDGMLFLDINREASCGKAWVPYDIDVASPLEVTNYIQPGTNVVRFIQLTSMVERTFILYASRRESEPDPSDPPPRDEVDARLFDDAVSAKPDNPLFNFSATVTLS
ncbi:hypothetical protein C8R43DRAFT_875160 [Mycena crocata]|nr:hypothetical protein C8R43DRAFT_875160 [Mycena crocata]